MSWDSGQGSAWANSNDNWRAIQELREKVKRLEIELQELKDYVTSTRNAPTTERSSNDA